MTQKAKLVYSEEVPRKIDAEKIIESAAFVPLVAGLIMAAEVVKDLTR